MAAHKLIFTFPPEFDGELHVFATEKKDGPVKSLKVKLIIHQKEHETVIRTIRELGRILSGNPVTIRELSQQEEKAV